MEGDGDVADDPHERQAVEVRAHRERQVDAGREVPAGAPEDEDADAVVTPGPLQPRLEPVEHRPVDGVPLVGPVDRERHHALGDIDEQRSIHPPNRSHRRHRGRIGTTGVADQAWSPHSVLPVPAQRPSRPRPGTVHGSHPIES